MDIAIVLLNYNGEKLLNRFLPTLDKYSSYKSDIYVIDNNSTDNSIKYVKLNFPEIKCIPLDKNYGFAEGYNKGLTNIDADVFCLLNTDIEVTENWLEPVHQVFLSNNNISIAQPNILDYNQKNSFEYSGAAGGFIDSYGYTYCRGRIFDSLEEDLGQYNDNKEIFWASGACFFIRKNIWVSLGGFDNDFFAHFEEIDLCWRAFNQNLKITSIGSSKVFHVGAATLPISGYKWYLNFRNSLILLTKNVPSKFLFRILLIRLILDFISALRFLLKGKLAPILSIIRAHFVFYINYKSHYNKRVPILNENNYWSTKSIVWSYFIKKNRVFSKISK